MIADAAMSLDNVVALAAIAGGDYWLLAIGVLISIPIIAYGALILSRITRHAPEILTIGAAFLGWIAGGMAVTDPLVAGWVQSNAPALAAFAPAFGALFVLAAGKGAEPRSARQTAAIAIVARPASKRPVAPLLWQQAAPVPVPMSETAAPAGTPPAIEDEPAPGFAMDSDAGSAPRGWTEERVIVAGFVLLALLAGLIIFIASFFDSLTWSVGATGPRTRGPNDARPSLRTPSNAPTKRASAPAAAWMYFVEEMTRSAIAETLGVGRVTVVRMLAETKAHCEVRIAVARQRRVSQRR